MEMCNLAGGKVDGDDISDLTKTYPIVEIFNSVQGEGIHAGKSSVFIRFGGCNLRCEWCDTEFDEWQEMSVIDILSEVMQWQTKRIIFTGGEPALQNLWPLSTCLRRRGYHIAIESNGTIELDEGLVDWVCISPKDQLYPNVSIKQRTGDELKVVYCGQELSMYDDLRIGFKHLLLQPCYMESESVEWNGRNAAHTEALVKENPEWRLSLQTHKWMGVD